MSIRYTNFKCFKYVKLFYPNISYNSLCEDEITTLKIKYQFKLLSFYFV